jgi:hypothetical protein
MDKLIEHGFWPLAIVVIAVLFLLMFRGQVKDLLARAQSARFGKSRIDLSAGGITVDPSDYSLTVVTPGKPKDWKPGQPIPVKEPVVISGTVKPKKPIPQGWKLWLINKSGSTYHPHGEVSVYPSKQWSITYASGYFQKGDTAHFMFIWSVLMDRCCSLATGE